jgi:hypothetical protein
VKPRSIWIAWLVTTLACVLGWAIPSLSAANTFRGKTSRGRDVSLYADAWTVSRFRIVADYKCTDGDRFRTRDSSFSKMTIRDGRFSDVSRDKRGAWVSKISGTITDSRAIGSYRGRVRYNRHNRFDKRGSIVCKSQTRFRAKGLRLTQIPGRTAPSSPAPAPRQPADWGALLTRTANQGAWYQPYSSSLENLWFFHTLGAAGYRQGTRNAFYNHNYGTSPFPADFIWYVTGNVLHYEWVPAGFVWHETQLLSYDSSKDELRVNSDDGGLESWYGCRSRLFPGLLRGPATCP